MAGLPFEATAQLDGSLVEDNLPGFPNTRLQNVQVLIDFLRKEILVTELDALAGHLPVQADTSTTISPLHYHRFKARDIYIIEDPGLHLTLIYDRLFLKPIPRYLLSHVFWSKYLLAQPSPLGPNQAALRRSALGFLRTYFYLIRHESDLRLALSNGLLPETVTWARWCAFAANLVSIADADVCPRYLHGELYLPRLNWLAKIHLHRFRYRESHGRRGGNLRRFYEPLLFLFGVLSLVLSAMQVALGALPDLNASRSWLGFVRTCRWMAIASLLLMALLLLVLPFQYALVWLSRALGLVARLLRAPVLTTTSGASRAQLRKTNV